MGTTRGILGVAGLAGVALCPTAVFAQAALTVQLSATPAAYEGRCPGVITFAGRIRSPPEGVVAGRPESPEVSYTFLRSDGATGPVKTTRVFNVFGTGVSATWTLGGAQLPSYAGWEQLKVWPAGHDDKAVLSPRAPFTLACAKEMRPR